MQKGRRVGRLAGWQPVGERYLKSVKVATVSVTGDRYIRPILYTTMYGTVRYGAVRSMKYLLGNYWLDNPENLLVRHAT